MQKYKNLTLKLKDGNQFKFKNNFYKKFFSLNILKMQNMFMTINIFKSNNNLMTLL